MALWIGLDVGMLTLVLGMGWYFSRLDWDLESQLARERSLKHSPVSTPCASDKGEQDEEVLGLLEDQGGSVFEEGRGGSDK